MKQALVATLIIFLASTFISVSFRKLKLPPGTIQLDDNFYVDVSETSNLAWIEHMYWTKQEFGEDSEQYKATLPDTVNNWYNHAEYRYYPIAMISYKQALIYCKWRSDFVNERHRFPRGKKVSYRLPTVEEWNRILKYQIEDLSFKKYQKIHQKRMEELFISSVDELSYFSVGPDTSSASTQKEKIYHLLDNVSEMTAEKGVSKGGNNLNVLPIETILKQSQSYARPHPYLGFRCVAKFVDK